MKYFIKEHIIRNGSLFSSDAYGPDFPGETFRVLKGKEEREYGEYRTCRLVLEAWDKLERDSSEKLERFSRL
jgi:hypothetical protein